MTDNKEIKALKEAVRERLELAKDPRADTYSISEKVYLEMLDEYIDKATKSATLAERRRCAEVARQYELPTDVKFREDMNKQNTALFGAAIATAIEAGEDSDA